MSLFHWTAEVTVVKDGTGARVRIETQPWGASYTPNTAITHTLIPGFSRPCVMAGAAGSASEALVQV